MLLRRALAYSARQVDFKAADYPGAAGKSSAWRQESNAARPGNLIPRSAGPGASRASTSSAGRS